MPLSLGSAPCTYKSNIQTDYLLGNPVLGVLCCIGKDTSKIIQRKKTLKAAKGIFVCYMQFNLRIHNLWNSIASV